MFRKYVLYTYAFLILFYINLLKSEFNINFLKLFGAAYN